MFNESSRLTIRLFREVKTKRGRTLVAVPGGRWQAPDGHGRLHHYDWQDRVRYFPISALDTSVHARYGLDGQLFHLQAALKDVAEHIQDDTRTLALVAEVDTVRNGAPGPHLQFRAEKP